MLSLLFFALSYGALLILLMPPTGIGILAVIALFAIGVALIVHTKIYKTAFWKSRRYLLSIAAFIALCLSLIFYHRWLPSSKMQAVASLFHMSIETLLTIGSLLLALLSGYVLFAGLHIVTDKVPSINSKNAFVANLLYCIIAAVATVILAQIMIDMDIFSMGLLNFLWGVLIVTAVILLLYCLFGKVLPSIYIGASAFMIISTINAYVYQFRQRLFEPVDVFSVGTAMNVAESYSLLPIPRSVLEGWSVFLALLVCLFCLLRKQQTLPSMKKRFALLAVCAVSFTATFFYASGLKTYHWHREGARNNGYLLDFVSKFKEISVQEPDDYSVENISLLAQQYSEDSHGTSTPPPRTSSLLWMKPSPTCV